MRPPPVWAEESMLDDLVDALDSGKDDDEILPLITEEADADRR